MGKRAIPIGTMKTQGEKGLLVKLVWSMEMAQAQRYKSFFLRGRERGERGGVFGKGG